MILHQHSEIIACDDSLLPSLLHIASSASDLVFFALWQKKTKQKQKNALLFTCVFLGLSRLEGIWLQAKAAYSLNTILSVAL